MGGVVVDHLSDLWFAADQAAVASLIEEGIPAARIFLLGEIDDSAAARVADVLIETAT